MGLLTTQKTSASLAIYPRNLDPIILKPKGLSGQEPNLDPGAPGPQLVTIDTNKVLGGGAGIWEALVKVPFSQRGSFEQSFSDGDWVDIVLQRGAKRYHTMRGIVETLDPGQRVSKSSGTTMMSYVLRGYDHQTIFERTPLWWNPFSFENIVGLNNLHVSMADGSIAGLAGVRDTVTVMLFGILREMKLLGRGVWPLPEQMPGGGSAFCESCVRLFSPDVDSPARVPTGLNFQTLDNALLWRLANEWCDPDFNELWCDLAKKAPPNAAVLTDILAAFGGDIPPEDYILHDEDALEPTDTSMAVFMRPRPFPTATHPDGLYGNLKGALPAAIISSEEIMDFPLQRSGAERYNTFDVASSTKTEITSSSMALMQPLMDLDDVQHRGIRLRSVRSRFHADLIQSSDATLVAKQREMLRDWSCLNPVFLSGEAELKTLRPGIRVGHYVAIDKPEGQFIAYVESIRHHWAAPGFGSTALGLTRGFRGGIEGGFDAMFAAQTKAAAKFQLVEGSPRFAKPGGENIT